MGGGGTRLSSIVPQLSSSVFFDDELEVYSDTHSLDSSFASEFNLCNYERYWQFVEESTLRGVSLAFRCLHSCVHTSLVDLFFCPFFFLIV